MPDTPTTTRSTQHSVGWIAGDGDAAFYYLKVYQDISSQDRHNRFLGRLTMYLVGRRAQIKTEELIKYLREGQPTDQESANRIRKDLHAVLRLINDVLGLIEQAPNIFRKRHTIQDWRRLRDQVHNLTDDLALFCDPDKQAQLKQSMVRMSRGESLSHEEFLKSMDV